MVNERPHAKISYLHKHSNLISIDEFDIMVKVGMNIHVIYWA